MSMSATLESKGFVATDSDVEALANAVLSAVEVTDNGRRSYLRTLVATTQKALGAEPRQRQGKPAKLDAAAVTLQMEALDATHRRFYTIVLRVAGENVPPNTKDRALEINRRTNFARTAMSAIRRWVRAGNDLTALAAKSVSKASLAVEGSRKPVVPKALKAKAERLAKGLLSSLMALADADRAAAVDEMQTLMGQLADQLSEMGVKLKKGALPFSPTETQVLRQQARPS
jgi:hypothetical protein